MLVNLKVLQIIFQVFFDCETKQEFKLLKYCFETSKSALNYSVGLGEQRQKNHGNKVFDATF